MIKIPHEHTPINADLPKEVIDRIKQITSVLDESYGSHRNPANDLGGFVVVIESPSDFESLQNDFLDVRDASAEYVDRLDCESGESWLSVLYLLSSDFAINLIMPITLAPQPLLEELERTQ